MRAMRFVAAIALTLLYAGCTKLRHYPLCVFGPDPKVGSNAQLRKKLEKYVRELVGENARVAISVNERIITIETDDRTHSVIALAWPRAACIGQTRYDAEFRNYKSCVYLLETAMQGNGLAPLGDWSDAINQDTFYCGTTLRPYLGAANSIRR